MQKKTTTWVNVLTDNKNKVDTIFCGFGLICIDNYSVANLIFLIYIFITKNDSFKICMNIIESKWIRNQ